MNVSETACIEIVGGDGKGRGGGGGGSASQVDRGVQWESPVQLILEVSEHVQCTCIHVLYICIIHTL